MYGYGDIGFLVILPQSPLGHPWIPQPLYPIHRPLYPAPPQSLTKGDPKSGLRFALAPAIWDLLPLPLLGAFLVLKPPAARMLFCPPRFGPHIEVSIVPPPRLHCSSVSPWKMMLGHMIRTVMAAPLVTSLRRLSTLEILDLHSGSLSLVLKAI